MVCVVTGNGSDMFISLVISVYPGYMSIKAVLSQDTEDDQRWLKYWVLISLFLIIQIPADWILAWAPGFSVGEKYFFLISLQANGPMPSNSMRINVLFFIEFHYLFFIIFTLR